MSVKKNALQVVGGTGGTLVPLPRRVGTLSTLKHVQMELGAVYRDARQGRIDPTEGSKLAFILGMLAKAIEASSLEQRLTALEGSVTDFRDDS